MWHPVKSIISCFPRTNKMAEYNYNEEIKESERSRLGAI